MKLENENENLNEPQNPQLNIVAVSGSASASDDVNSEQEEDYWTYLKRTAGGKRPEGVVRGYMRTWEI